MELGKTGDRRRGARNRRASAALGAVLLMATACGGGGGKGGGDNAVKADSVPTPQITITPADGTGKAAPDKGIQISAANGTLDTVSVKLGSKDVPGQLSADKTSWKSDWTLKPASAYTVTATARNGTKTSTANSKFHTLKATSSLKIASVFPTPGKKVGVGMPIIVTFNRAVTNKKAVEQAMDVRSEIADEGAWYWASDTEAIFRTKKYWGANQKIDFTAHLAGVKQGSGVYGTSDTKVDFKIGDSHISKVSTKTAPS